MGYCSERRLHCPGTLLIHELMRLTSAFYCYYSLVCVREDVCIQADRCGCHGDMRVIGQTRV